MRKYFVLFLLTILSLFVLVSCNELVEPTKEKPFFNDDTSSFVIEENYQVKEEDDLSFSAAVEIDLKGNELDLNGKEFTVQTSKDDTISISNGTIKNGSIAILVSKGTINFTNVTIDESVSNVTLNGAVWFENVTANNVYLKGGSLSLNGVTDEYCHSYNDMTKVNNIYVTSEALYEIVNVDGYSVVGNIYVNESSQINVSGTVANVVLESDGVILTVNNYANVGNVYAYGANDVVDYATKANVNESIATNESYKTLMTYNASFTKQDSKIVPTEYKIEEVHNLCTAGLEEEDSADTYVKYSFAQGTSFVTVDTVKLHKYSDESIVIHKNYLFGDLVEYTCDECGSHIRELKEADYNYADCNNFLEILMLYVPDYNVDFAIDKDMEFTIGENTYAVKDGYVHLLADGGNIGGAIVFDGEINGEIRSYKLYVNNSKAYLLGERSYEEETTKTLVKKINKVNEYDAYETLVNFACSYLELDSEEIKGTLDEYFHYFQMGLSLFETTLVNGDDIFTLVETAILKVLGIVFDEEALEKLSIEKILFDYDEETDIYTLNLENITKLFDYSLKQFVDYTYGDGTTDEIVQFLVNELPNLTVSEFADYVIKFAKMNRIDSEKLFETIDQVVEIITGKDFDIYAFINEFPNVKLSSEAVDLIPEVEEVLNYLTQENLDEVTSKSVGTLLEKYIVNVPGFEEFKYHDLKDNVNKYSQIYELAFSLGENDEVTYLYYVEHEVEEDEVVNPEEYVTYTRKEYSALEVEYSYNGIEESLTFASRSDCTKQYEEYAVNYAKDEESFVFSLINRSDCSKEEKNTIVDIYLDESSEDVTLMDLSINTFDYLPGDYYLSVDFDNTDDTKKSGNIVFTWNEDESLVATYQGNGNNVTQDVTVTVYEYDDQGEVVYNDEIPVTRDVKLVDYDMVEGSEKFYINVLEMGTVEGTRKDGITDLEAIFDNEKATLEYSETNYVFIVYTYEYDIKEIEEANANAQTEEEKQTNEILTCLEIDSEVLEDKTNIDFDYWQKEKQEDEKSGEEVLVVVETLESHIDLYEYSEECIKFDSTTKYTIVGSSVTDLTLNTEVRDNVKDIEFEIKEDSSTDEKTAIKNAYLAYRYSFDYEETEDGELKVSNEEYLFEFKDISTNDPKDETVMGAENSSIEVHYESAEDKEILKISRETYTEANNTINTLEFKFDYELLNDELTFSTIYKTNDDTYGYNDDQEKILTNTNILDFEVEISSGENYEKYDLIYEKSNKSPNINELDSTKLVVKYDQKDNDTTFDITYEAKTQNNISKVYIDFTVDFDYVAEVLTLDVNFNSNEGTTNDFDETMEFKADIDYVDEVYTSVLTFNSNKDSYELNDDQEKVVKQNISYDVEIDFGYSKEEITFVCEYEWNKSKYNVLTNNNTINIESDFVSDDDDFEVNVSFDYYNYHFDSQYSSYQYKEFANFTYNLVVVDKVVDEVSAFYEYDKYYFDETKQEYVVSPSRHELFSVKLNRSEYAELYYYFNIKYEDDEINLVVTEEEVPEEARIDTTISYYQCDNPSNKQLADDTYQFTYKEEYVTYQDNGEEVSRELMDICYRYVESYSSPTDKYYNGLAYGDKEVYTFSLKQELDSNVVTTNVCYQEKDYNANSVQYAVKPNNLNDLTKGYDFDTLIEYNSIIDQNSYYESRGYSVINYVYLILDDIDEINITQNKNSFDLNYSSYDYNSIDEEDIMSDFVKMMKDSSDDIKQSGNNFFLFDYDFTSNELYEKYREPEVPSIISDKGTNAELELDLNFKYDLGETITSVKVSRLKTIDIKAFNKYDASIKWNNYYSTLGDYYVPELMRNHLKRAELTMPFYIVVNYEDKGTEVCYDAYGGIIDYFNLLDEMYDVEYYGEEVKLIFNKMRYVSFDLVANYDKETTDYSVDIGELFTYAEKANYDNDNPTSTDNLIKIEDIKKDLTHRISLIKIEGDSESAVYEMNLTDYEYSYMPEIIEEIEYEGYSEEEIPTLIREILSIPVNFDELDEVIDSGFTKVKEEIYWNTNEGVTTIHTKINDIPDYYYDENREQVYNNTLDVYAEVTNIEPTEESSLQKYGLSLYYYDSTASNPDERKDIIYFEFTNSDELKEFIVDNLDEIAYVIGFNCSCFDIKTTCYNGKYECYALVKDLDGVVTQINFLNFEIGTNTAEIEIPRIDVRYYQYIGGFTGGIKFNIDFNESIKVTVDIYDSITFGFVIREDGSVDVQADFTKLGIGTLGIYYDLNSERGAESAKDVLGYTLEEFKQLEVNDIE